MSARRTFIPAAGPAHRGRQQKQNGKSQGNDRAKRNGDIHFDSISDSDSDSDKKPEAEGKKDVNDDMVVIFSDSVVVCGHCRTFKGRASTVAKHFGRCQSKLKAAGLSEVAAANVASVKERKAREAQHRYNNSERARQVRGTHYYRKVFQEIHPEEKYVAEMFSRKVDTGSFPHFFQFTDDMTENDRAFAGNIVQTNLGLFREMAELDIVDPTTVRTLLRLWHPDKFGTKSAPLKNWADQCFKRFNNFRDALNNNHRRVDVPDVGKHKVGEYKTEVLKTCDAIEALPHKIRLQYTNDLNNFVREKIQSPTKKAPPKQPYKQLK